MTALDCGVILTATHGAFFDSHHGYMAPAEFKAAIVKDLHTHEDSRSSLQPSRVIVDPKSLRSIRSEGDKQAESDRNHGGWDAYQA